MTDPPPHLLLMGLRASGKSTLARLIAEKTNIPALDLDHLVLQDMGAGSIEEIWRIQGEPAFRQAETLALSRLLASETPTILALGGGTPTAPGAADLLREASATSHAFLVYLRLSPDILRARLTRHDDPNRPSLTGAGIADELDTVFAQRDPLYRDLADLVIERAQTPAKDAQDILRAWRSQSS